MRNRLDPGADIAARRRASTLRTSRLRLILEIGAVVVTLLVCVAAARLSPPDTTLVVGLVVAAIAVLRALPEARSPRLPADAAPGRGGRRAEVYRLSWGLSSGHDTVSTQVLHRVRALVAERLEAERAGAGAAPTGGAGAGPREAPLTQLRELTDGPLRSARLRPADLHRTLTALDELDQLDELDRRGTR